MSMGDIMNVERDFGQNPEYARFARELWGQMDFRQKLPMSEPYFFSFGEPGGSDFAQQFAAERVAADGRQSVIVLETPPPPQKGIMRVEVCLADTMLRQFNHPAAGKRINVHFKWRHAAKLVEERGISLIILTHLEHVMTAEMRRRRPRFTNFYYLFSGLKSVVKPLMVLFVGEGKTLAQLVRSDSNISTKNIWLVT